MLNHFKKLNLFKKITLLIITILMLLLITFSLYVNDYYKANSYAQNILDAPQAQITITKNDDQIIFAPQQPKAGLIFYPGAKVEHSAYAPLMAELAKSDILCILVKMPFNLAFFDLDAASNILLEHNDINNWYLAGHSLGGSMAAYYLSETKDQFKGLILLASYSTANLSNKNLKVLSILASNDKVINFDNYQENKQNLPQDSKEIVIEGGCHSFFGSYGLQKNDGNCTITNQEQIKQTSIAISDLIN